MNFEGKFAKAIRPLPTQICGWRAGAAMLRE
jgi:hypothetical protein